MRPLSRQQLLLIAFGLAVVAFIVVRLQEAGSPAGSAAAASNQPGAAPAAAQTSVADVKLEALQDTTQELGESQRNPFRFQSRRAPAAPAVPRPSAPPPPPPVSTGPSVQAGPPAPPPIPLRYIGVVEAPSQAGRIAMLSDGRGNVFHGREGDIIEGRYRILRVGPESAELAYLDGRGRQTIRLSGQ